ncbi:MAG: symporter-like protein [Methylocystaceae bacterium]|nr:MAG: symporter-like protein [Methylocystaceae bacterium]
MRNQTTNEAWLSRARLDGRIAFAGATFTLAYALVALLDRVGAPERLVSVVSPYFTVLALALLGFLLHSMRVSFYYAAGRVVPASYAGLANAAIFAGLASPFAAHLTGRSSVVGIAAGFLLGVAGVALLMGPALRKTGAFSLSELLAARFSQLEPRLGMIVVAAASSALVAFAGYQTAVDGIVGFTGTGRPFAAFFIGAAILLIAGPGGLTGVLWSACVAAGVILAGFGLPEFVLALRGFAPPLPLLGDAQAWSEAVRRLEAWRLVTPSAGFRLDLTTTLGLGLGVATLAPALLPAVTTRGPTGAWRAGAVTLFWSIVIVALVAAALAASALTLSRVAVGRAPEQLPDALYSASSCGLLQICGARVEGPAEARRACLSRNLAPGAPLRAEDIAASPEYLIGGLPQIAKLGADFSGLVASAVIAAGLILAAAGLHACATAVGHDAVYRLRAESALTSRRLAITRLVLVAVTALGSATSAANAIDARTLVGLALAISAAGFVPVVGLALWPRAQNKDAMVGQSIGVGVMTTVLVTSAGVPTIETLSWAGLAGGLLGFGAGAATARVWSKETEDSRRFVAAILRGDGQVLGEDKGA